MKNAEIIMMPLGNIKPYKHNPRINDGSVEYVANSIKEFGFKQPIVVDKGMTIIAGHTRYKAAQELGLKEVPVIIADDLTKDQVKAYRLADNKVGEQSLWDFELLDMELDGIGIDMSDFGFRGDEFIEFEEPEEKEYEYPDAMTGSLADKFIIPPFSVFDTRQGYWLERTRLWRAKIRDNAQARPDAQSITLKMSETDKGVSLLNPTLSEVIVSWFRPKSGNKCFDPFAGDTIFGFVSSYMGMDFTGIEIRQEQVDFNTERVQEYGLPARYICDDGQNVLDHIEENSQDLLFSCPPYYDLEHYSDLPNDASNQETYEDFYKIIEKAFTDSIKCLKDDRFAVIVVGDIRDKKGAYYDFISDIKDTFIRNGMCLYNEIILINSVGTAALRASNSMRNRKVTKVHQNVLVFYKGDISHIGKKFGEVEVLVDDGEDEQVE